MKYITDRDIRSFPNCGQYLHWGSIESIGTKDIVKELTDHLTCHMRTMASPRTIEWILLGTKPIVISCWV